MEPDDYARFGSWQEDPWVRKWNLWEYVDVRDVAQAVRRAPRSRPSRSEIAIVAAADTCMRRDSADLGESSRRFPPADPRGRETLLSIDRARAILGYAPGTAGSTRAATPRPS
jgi:nucleoside-diphosphate-sugar epimerase